MVPFSGSGETMVARRDRNPLTAKGILRERSLASLFQRVQNNRLGSSPVAAKF
jgi:hypothetical protein